MARNRGNENVESYTCGRVFRYVEIVTAQEPQSIRLPHPIPRPTFQPKELLNIAHLHARVGYAAQPNRIGGTSSGQNCAQKNFLKSA
jgi:hypothetical protein